MYGTHQNQIIDSVCSSQHRHSEEPIVRYCEGIVINMLSQISISIGDGTHSRPDQHGVTATTWACEVAFEPKAKCQLHSGVEYSAQRT